MLLDVCSSGDEVDERLGAGLCGSLSLLGRDEDVRDLASRCFDRVGSSVTLKRYTGHYRPIRDRESEARGIRRQATPRY